ncbi:hypothetical protein GCM10028825_25940 [Spirosoma agri]
MTDYLPNKFKVNSRNSFGYVCWNQSIKAIDGKVDITKISGYVCIRFYGLSYKTSRQMQSIVANDPYTRLTYTYKKGSSLVIIVETGCQDEINEKNYSKKVASHYQSLMPINSALLKISISRGFSVCHNPNVHYNPVSKVITLFDDNEPIVKEIKEMRQPVLEDAPVENTLSLITSTNNQNHDGSSFDDERETASVLSSIFNIYKWHSNHYDTKTSTEILVKPNSNNKELIQISFGRTEGKKRESINFEYDSISKAIIICSNKVGEPNSSKGHREAIDHPEVNVYLVALLETGQIPQGEVQQLLEMKYNRKNRTIRNTITRIIADQSIHKNTSGKSVIVAKRSDGNKHYLYLSQID